MTHTLLERIQLLAMVMCDKICWQPLKDCSNMAAKIHERADWLSKLGALVTLQGWKLNRKWWGHVHVAGNNVKTKIRNNTRSEEKKICLLQKVNNRLHRTISTTWIHLMKIMYYSFHQWTQTKDKYILNTKIWTDIFLLIILIPMVHVD